MNAPLIGFAGAARSGKDTAAQALADTGWTCRAFADKVRDILYATNLLLDEPSYSRGFTTLKYEVDQYGWEAAKEMYPELRRYLQRLGTEGGREILGENVWVDALFRDRDTWGPTVITDVRFPNEADAIRARGGLVIAIQRPGQEQIPDAEHVSETALRGYLFDDVILNDGPVTQLHDRVMQLLPLLV
ncbi:deoxynucleotide monophosphate kinase family protein [Streptomyces microflavus]|uniref:deoxynucleotide monophosphate kinase family protein n=1 Tax=Streptomyces microflavus TaxID=1919 RepID=UPI0036EB63E7